MKNWFQNFLSINLRITILVWNSLFILPIKEIAHLLHLTLRNSIQLLTNMFWQMLSTLRNCTTDDKILWLIMPVENTYCFSAMKLANKNKQRAASTLPWAVLMVLRYVNLQDFVFSQTWEIYFVKQTLDCTVMMD